MIKIVKRLREMNIDTDYSFISNEGILLYQLNIHESVLKSKNGKDKLKDLFPETSSELIQILEDLLEFNPYFRPTPKEIL